MDKKMFLINAKLFIVVKFQNLKSYQLKSFRRKSKNPKKCGER
jgi:ribosomal protein L10